MTAIKPLTGIRVLDLTQLPPGGYCAIQLADLGAEVLRVDAPSQAGKPSLVLGQVGLSRGKRSITLDQRHAQANDVLKRLVKSVDVVLENAKPGAMEARGFGYPQAAADNPAIIWCSITGFGQDGPYADQAGHDLSYVAHSGLLAGLAPDLPWHPATVLAVPTAALMGANGILAALLERGRTGKGCQIDISIAESATWLLSGMGGAFKDGWRGVQPTPDRRLYLCADEAWISTAAAEPRTWAALCKGLGVDDLIDKLSVVKGEEGPAIAQRLAGIFKTKPAAEWVALLAPTGAAVTAVNIGPDVARDPQYVARGAMLEVAGEPVPANPVRLVDAAGNRSATAAEPPALTGADTDHALAAAGFTPAEIAQLRADGVV